MQRGGTSAVVVEKTQVRTSRWGLKVGGPNVSPLKTPGLGGHEKGWKSC